MIGLIIAKRAKKKIALNIRYKYGGIQMDIRLSDNIQIDSIVDGEGIRAVLWTQGCGHNCARMSKSWNTFF